MNPKYSGKTTYETFVFTRAKGPKAILQNNEHLLANNM